jgi:ribosomal protein S8
MKHSVESIKNIVASLDGYAFFPASEVDDETIQELKNNGYIIELNSLEISPGEWTETVDIEWPEQGEGA